MPDALERYRPLRVSVRRLRAQLVAHGPSSVEALTRVVRVDDERLGPKDVKATLLAHPRVFAFEGGKWVARPREEVYVVHRRPRPRPNAVRRGGASSPATRPKGAKRSPQPAPWRPANRPEHDIPVITVDTDNPDTTLYESGGRLLATLPVPQNLDLQSTGSTSLGDIAVYEAQPGRDSIYRGTRSLLTVEAGPRPGVARLLLGTGRDDEAMRVGVERPMLLPPTTDRGLVVWREATETALQDTLPPRVRPVAGLPFSRTTTDRQAAYREAGARLRPIRDDARRWSEFAEWLSQHKPLYDQGLLEGLLVMALNTPGTTPANVVQLAIVLLSGLEPISLPFAQAMAATASTFQDEVAIDFSARCLLVARRLNGVGPDLDHAAAAIAINEDRYADACAAFAQLQTAGATTATDIGLWVDAAQLTGRDDFQAQALHGLSVALDACEDPEELWSYRAALQSSMAFKRGHDRLVADLERLLRIAVFSIPDHAVNEYRVHAPATDARFRLTDRLRLLSVLEDLEYETGLAELLGVLQGLVDVALRQIDESVMWDLWRQLALVEEATGGDHTSSDYLAIEITARAARLARRPEEPPALPLAGHSVTLVGGRPGTRVRCRIALEELGASSIREVPPHWEEHLDRRAIDERVSDADYVALLTDETGHDATNILRELRGTRRFKLVHTSGGPSQVVRDLLHSM